MRVNGTRQVENFEGRYVRSVVGTHMLAFLWRKVSAAKVPLKMHKSVSDLFNCTAELTPRQVAAHKMALEIGLVNRGKDPFETTRPRKVTVAFRSIPFAAATAYIEECNLLVEVHKKAIRDPPWAGRCLVVRGLSLRVVHVALDVRVVKGFSCRNDSILGEVLGRL